MFVDGGRKLVEAVLEALYSGEKIFLVRSTSFLELLRTSTFTIVPAAT